MDGTRAALVALAGDWIWNADTAGAITHFSTSPSQAGEREAMLGWGWLDLVHPTDRDRVVAAWRRAVTQVSPYRDTFRLLDRRGNERVILARAVRSGDDEPVSWIGSWTLLSDGPQEEDHPVLLSGHVAETNLWAMLEASPLSIVTLDRNGNITTWNRAAERIFGWTAQEVVGKPAPTIPPEGLPSSDEVRQRVLEGEAVTSLERVRLRKDGARIYMNYATAPLLDESGAVIGTVILGEDITARKLAEMERDLALSVAQGERQRLRDLFMQAPALIAVMRGPDHRFSLVNQKFVAVLGDRQYLGVPARDALPDLDAQSVFELLDGVYSSGTAGETHELPLTLSGPGRARIFNIVVQPTHDATGTTDGCMLLAVDVTDQVQARARAEEMAAERAAVLGQIAEGIILTDADGTLVFVNQAARDLHGIGAVGISLEEYVRLYHVYTPTGEVFPARDVPLARAMRGETVVNAEFLIRRSDGREIVAEGSATPVVLPDGTRIGAVLSVRDVTQQRNLDRQKDEFLAAAAHDLKTPLTSIKGYAQILTRRIKRSDRPDSEGLADGLGRIVSTSTRMTRLIDELLDVTRIQMGYPLQLNRERTDLVALVQTAVEDHPPSAVQHRILLHTPPGPIIGEWDPDRIARVVNNLLSNAIKYSPSGSDIDVSVQRVTDESAVISVRDRGIGIPPDELERIFHRFHRAHNVGASIPGAGVGLAAVQQIVEQHGGRVQVESAPGEGAVFTVTLPVNGGTEVRAEGHRVAR